jgi:hypothetical protein
MARKRTKAEKIAAKLRRQLAAVNTQKPQITTTLHSKSEYPVEDNAYLPELTLSTKLLARDLTKSLAVTILALVLQFSLAVYLNRGGWQQVNSMLLKMAANF